MRVPFWGWEAGRSLSGAGGWPGHVWSKPSIFCHQAQFGDGGCLAAPPPATRSNSTVVSTATDQVPVQVRVYAGTCLTTNPSTKADPTAALSSHVHSGLFCESKSCFLLPQLLLLPLLSDHHPSSENAVFLHIPHTGRASRAEFPVY